LKEALGEKATMNENGMEEAKAVSDVEANKAGDADNEEEAKATNNFDANGDKKVFKDVK
jgi:hypothetical protein